MDLKTKKIIAALSLSFMLLTGCSSLTGRQNDDVGSPTESGGDMAPISDEKPGIVPPDWEPGDQTTNLNNEQKLVKSATIAMTAKNIDTAQTEIDLIAKRFTGYVYHMQQSQTTERRYLTITIKVATAHFDEAIAQIRKLGTTSSVTLDVSDVTTQFIDTEARIKTLKTKEDTLTAILAKATEIEDILTIESSLQQTRQEIESYQGQLNALKNATDFSKISVQVSDETGLAVTQEPESPWDEFRSNFNRGLRYWADAAVDIVSGILFLLPVLIPLAIIALILRFLIRRNPNHWSKRRGPGSTAAGYSKTAGQDPNTSLRHPGPTGPSDPTQPSDPSGPTDPSDDLKK